MTPTLTRPTTEVWTKPADKPMPPLPQDRPARGNRTILVLVDSSQPAHADVHATTIAALRHWGMPYEVCDLAAGLPPQDFVTDRAAILLAQEYLGRSFTAAWGQIVLTALRHGTGLCSLDPWLNQYPPSFTQALQLRSGPASSNAALVVHTQDHFVTAFRDDNESIALRQAVEVKPLAGPGIDLLHAALPQSVLHGGTMEKGRFIWWGVSPKIWLPETLGHAWGLDDLFWRGLVWVARKPFVMKAMPPLATMRFDDSGGLSGLWWMMGHAASLKTPFPAELRRIMNLQCGGAASVLHKFNYVKILNRLGWKPEVSLFVDQVFATDWAALKEIHDRGGVQVSCHGFRDGYDADGHWRSHFLTQEGLEVQTPAGPKIYHCLTPDEFSGESGRFTYCIPRDGRAESLPNYRFAPWPDDVLDENFRRLDQLWQSKGIQPGRTTNIHWRNPPSNCLAPLKQRGQTFSMWTSRYNHATVDPAAYAWRMLPYGDAGMCLDYMPIPVDAPTIAPTDFFNAQAHVFLRALKYDPIASDVDFFRCQKPPKPGLLTHHDLDLVAASISHQAKLGLQSLFFACPLTHEMNLATLTAAEWTDVMTQVERRLQRYPKEFVLYDTIAAAARAKCETHIACSAWQDQTLAVTLDGHAETDFKLWLFTDENQDVRSRMVNVPAFTEHTRLCI